MCLLCSDAALYVCVMMSSSAIYVCESCFKKDDDAVRGPKGSVREGGRVLIIHVGIRSLPFVLK